MAKKIEMLLKVEETLNQRQLRQVQTDKRRQDSPTEQQEAIIAKADSGMAEKVIKK